MIEGLALAYWVYWRYGGSVVAAYWGCGALLSYVACGFFTRGRNEELQELLATFSRKRRDFRRPPASPAAMDCGFLPVDCGDQAMLDGASTLAPTLPAVRRAGGTLEVFAEVPRCAVNPWVNATWRVTAAERLKMAVLAPFLLPARLAMIVMAVTVAILVANLATLGWGSKQTSRSRSGESQPLTKQIVIPDSQRIPRWRRLLGRPVLWCVRFLLCALGFWWIDVEGEVEDAAVLVCNHLSMIEPLVLLYLTSATPVASSEFAKLPALGPVGRLHQLLWLDRSEESSRAAVVEAIQHRVFKNYSGEKWPPVLVFPEGTTLNGRALISFKNGAFSPGASVQPCVASLPFDVRWGMGLDCSWTTAGPQMGELMVRMLLQPWNRVRVAFLKTHEPSAAEREDASLFAETVRQDMASALDVPTTEHSWADMWLNMTARDLGMEPHKTLVELNSLRSVLGKSYDRRRAVVALRRFASADASRRGKLDLAQFVAALSATPSSFDAKALETLFAALSEEKGEVSFFEFLVGFALLDVGASASVGGLRLIFRLLDLDGRGLVSRRRVQRSLFAQPERAQDDDAFISDDAATDTLTCEEFVAFVEANRHKLRDAWLTPLNDSSRASSSPAEGTVANLA